MRLSVSYRNDALQTPKNYRGDPEQLLGKRSADLKPCCNALVQQLPAGGAHDFFLAVQFIEGIGFEHYAFPVRAVGQAKEMPDLVGSLLHDAIDEIIVISPPSIIFIVQAGSGNYTGTYGFAGQAEDETVPVPEQVLVDYQQHRFGDIMPVLVCLDTVQQGLGINLPADHIQSCYAHMVLGHRCFDTEDRFNAP
jgi:hypothetical protein